MNGDGHTVIGRIAFDTLPEWEREIIRPDMSKSGLDRPYLSSDIHTVRDKVAYLCSIMDLVYYDECRLYATLPDGRWIPHSPPDEDGYSSAGVGTKYSPLASANVIELLMNRTVESIRAANWEEAVRYGGALAHYLQEPFAPGHAVSNDLFHELFPDPEPERHIRVHHHLDHVGLDFDPLPPALMGTTVSEAAFRLQIELDRGIVEGKKLVGPLLQGIYEGKSGAECAPLLNGQGRLAAHVTASAWHTAISIALGRFGEAEVRELETLDVTRMIPYFWHHWHYVHLTPGCLVADSRKIPIHIWVEDSSGRREERVHHGFGMGGHMGVKFFVNGDAYPRFRCRIGLPSRHTEGQTEHTDTEFFVETDRELNTTYSEDIEYGGTSVFAARLRPGEPALEIEADLTGARTLILSAQSQPHTDPDTGRLAFSIPHIAVCEPVLVRA